MDMIFSQTSQVQSCLFAMHLNIHLLLLLALEPTLGFNLLSDSLLLCSSFTLLSAPSYSHYLYIFFDIYSPSLPWSPMHLIIIPHYFRFYVYNNPHFSLSSLLHLLQTPYFTFKAYWLRDTPTV